MKTVQRYAVIITAILFAGAILFTGCSNNAGGGKPPVNPPAVQNVQLTVKHDTNIAKVVPESLTVTKGAAWSAVKGNFMVTYEGGYEAAGWKFESAGGADILDETVFTKDTTVFVLSKPTSPGETVRLTIRGDERIDEAASGFIDIGKNKTWAEVKTKVKEKAVLKTEWSAWDYGVYEWHLADENGTLITDTAVFTADTVVYAVTNYTKFKMEGAVVKGYSSWGEAPRGKIIIPAKNGETDITEIAKGAFSNTGLTQVNFPAALRAIGSYAFSECTGLTGTLSFPANLTTIGSAAFSECRGLTGTLSFPANLTTISDKAFSECTGLTGTLNFPATVKTIGNKAFYDCTGLTQVNWPGHLTAIADGVFGGCEGLTQVSLPVTLTKIGSLVFAGCTGLTQVNLPASLKEIDSRAFENCTSLTSLNLSVNLKTIGSSAFSGCTGLTGAISLPGKLESIAYSAFSGCNHISNVDFSACTQLTVIDNSAFEDCSGLTGPLNLPASLKNIGYSAFSGCNKVSNFDFTACERLTRIENMAFRNCSPTAVYKIKRSSPIRKFLLSSGNGITPSQIIEVP